MAFADDARRHVKPAGLPCSVCAAIAKASKKLAPDPSRPTRPPPRPRRALRPDRHRPVGAPMGSGAGGMILGMAGLARSGKDTAAAHLIAAHGYERRAFADPIRSALYALDPNVHVHGRTMRLAAFVDVVGWDRAKQAPDVRRLLQRLGTEVAREQWGERFWVQRATHDLTPGDRVVFTDVRFPNEADAIRALGGLVIKITRPGAGLDASTATHPSEALDFPVDVHIANDGTLEDLHQAVDRLVHPSSPSQR